MNTRVPARPGSPLDLLTRLRQSGLPPSQSVAGLTVEQLAALLDSIWRRGNLVVKPFMAQLVSTGPILTAEYRSYFFLQNQSGAQQLFLNFGRAPGTANTPQDGVIIGANLGAYEPICVPQDDIYVTASANNTPGVIVYAR